MKNSKSREYEFRNIGGSLFFYCGDQLLYGPSLGEPLAFAFDKDSGILHKHGSLPNVQAWLDNAVQKFRDGGYEDMANDLAIVSGPSEGENAWDVEVVNKFVNNSGYIGLWYKKEFALRSENILNQSDASNQEENQHSFS